jgi:acetyl esterase
MEFDHIQHYAYSKELPPTDSFGDIDLEDPAIFPEILEYRESLRKGLEKYAPEWIDMDGVPCVRVRDSACLPPSHPQDAGCKAPVTPAILYLHGGSFIFPLQEMMLRNAAYYAENLHIPVFLPEYRLAPEHPFPAGFEDCVTCHRYLISHANELCIDPSKIIILGDSAGGALAAALCQKLRDDTLPRPAASVTDGKAAHQPCLPRPICQVLIYPVTDNRMQQQSFKDYAHGSWSAAANRHMWNMYLKGCDKYAAPLRASSFADLPDAYIEVCEMDCLRDEGLEYADALSKAGVNVELRVIKGAYHGYDGFFDSSLTKQSLSERVSYMRKKCIEL